MARVERSRSRELKILQTIAEALNGATSVDQALQATLEQVAALLRLETGWIWLTDPASGKYYTAVAQRLPPFLRQPVRMTGRACWCLNAFAGGELRAGNIDVMECSRLRAAVGAADRARTRGLRYHASIPLYFGGRPLGIMNVAAPEWRKLTVRELDLLSTIASQVGVAIERARLASESVSAARMEERERLAREIHDTLAQRLTAIGLHVEAALDAASDARVREPLHRALEMSRAGLDEARGSMRTLRRPSSGRALRDRLETLARGFAGETGTRVHVDVDDRSVLTNQDEDELFYLISEALTNIRKHARATDVDVSLGVRGRSMRLEISDNGRGFDPRARSGGFGIIGMRERARALGGTLRIVSRRTGTRILLSIAAPRAPR